MAFATRWDWLLDKAVKASGQHPARLCLGWPRIISEAHKNRHCTGAEEIQHLAEVQWWNQILPDQPFPEGWKSEGDAVDKSVAASGSAPQIDFEQVVYKSCWRELKEKALCEGILWETLVENYKRRILYSVDNYVKLGPAVVQFRSELLTWRDLFPDEVFVGIDPQTGAQNLRTSNIVREDNAAEQAKKGKQVAVGDNEIPDAIGVQVKGEEAASSSFFLDQDDLSHYENRSENRHRNPGFDFAGPSARLPKQDSQVVEEEEEEERARQEFRRHRDPDYVEKDLSDNNPRGSFTIREPSARIPTQQSQQSSPGRQKSSRGLLGAEAPGAEQSQERNAVHLPLIRTSGFQWSPRDVRGGQKLSRGLFRAEAHGPEQSQERNAIRSPQGQETMGGTLLYPFTNIRHRSRSPKARDYLMPRRERSPLRERDERGSGVMMYTNADSRASRRDERVDNRRENRDESMRRDMSSVRSAVRPDDREVDHRHKEVGYGRARRGGARRRPERPDVGAELRSYGQKKGFDEAGDRRP